MLLPVVDVGGDHVDVLVAGLEHRLLPGAEGRHRGERGAARDELEVLVLAAHGPGGLGGDPPVLRGGLVPDLPGSVHLVAQAPHPDAEGLGPAVFDAAVGQRGAGRGVGVLEHVQRLLHPAGAEVDGIHRLHLRALRPGHELVQAEGVGLGGVPGAVVATGPLLARAHAVLPAVVGDEVPAGIADRAHAQLAGQLEHVAAQPVGVGRGVARLVQARVDAAGHVLDEAAEGASAHGADLVGGVDGEGGALGHRESFARGDGRAGCCGWCECGPRAGACRL